MKKTKQLPTILGFLIVLAGVAAGAFFIKEGTSRFLRASPEIIPKQIKITNIGPERFNVSWVTDIATVGLIKYGLDQDLTFTSQDDRDKASGNSSKFFTHYVTVENLKPQTNYFFTILSDNKTFDNNGQVYQVTTANQIQGLAPENDVAYGIITKADNSVAEGAIVYLSLSNTSPQSSLTTSSGNWVIPLSSSLAIGLNEYASYDREASIEEIFVQAGQLGTATAMATTRNDSPMANIVLGQTFDFRASLQPTSPPLPTTPPKSGFLTVDAEDLPSFSASPSASLTPTNTPTSIPTTSPIPSPGTTASPTPTISLTATISPTLTATPTGRISMPSTESGVPESGSLTPTFLFSIMGLVLVIAGFSFNILIKKTNF